jgi:GNAT superfamily N-acetyltransferase
LSYELREVTPSEVSALIQEVVDTRAFLERKSDDAPFVVEAADMFGDHPEFRVFALADGGSCPVGFVMLIPGNDDGVLDVGPTYVSPRLRGQGLGKLMLAQVVAWAPEHGLRRLVVATWGENSRARHVFEAVGFCFTHEELNTRVNGDSTVHFALDLSGPDSEEQ